MRVGLSTYTYPWAIGIPGFRPERPMTALDLIALADQLHVPLVQFADNLPLHHCTDGYLLELLQAAAAAGIGVEVGTRGIGNHLLRYVAIAQQAGATFVRLVIATESSQPGVERTLELLEPFESAFRNAGLKLAIENHDRLTSGHLVGLVRELGDWVGICLDTVNSLGALETPRHVVETLAPHAINLHLKDVTVRRQKHQMGFDVIGTPAGSGMLDIPWVLNEVGRFGAVDSAILELWTPPGATLEDTIALEAAWARVSLEYLRTGTTLMFTANAAAAVARS